MSKVDPAAFYWLKEKELIGMILTHVDDLIIAGNHEFYRNQIEEVKNKFKISKEESITLNYIGIQIEQTKDNIILHQTEYKEELEEAEIDQVRVTEVDEELNEEEKKSLKSIIGKLNWLATQSCPEISFEVCGLSTSQKNASVKTLIQANKILKKVKHSTTYLNFPKLDITELQLLCYTDASHNNLPNGGSQGGMIIFLSDGVSSAPLAWYSKKLKRVARSALAAEAMAVAEGADHGRNFKLFLDELLPGKSPSKVETFTDSKSLYDTSDKTKAPLDRSIRVDIASIRERIEMNEISLTWVNTKSQVADVFTKQGVNSKMIQEILKGGITPNSQI